MNQTTKTALLAADFVAIALYSFVNHPTGSVTNLGTSFDQLIPLVPAFVIPYLIFLPFYWAALVYSYVKGTRFVAFSASHIATFLIASFIYTVFQTEVTRPAELGMDIFSQLLGLVYQLDPPYNAFPSLHVAAAVLLGVYSSAIRGRWTTPILIFVGLVAISTVFLKQHYLSDIAGGIVLAGLAGYFGFKFFKN